MAREGVPMMAREYRQRDESYRLAEKLCDLLIANPHRRAGRLLKEILEDDGDLVTDGRIMRRLNKKLEGK